jgi:hypothetical protein
MKIDRKMLERAEHPLYGFGGKKDPYNWKNNFASFF